MGSSLGLFLADIFQAKLEGLELKSTISGLRHYYWCVDDILCATEQNEDIDEVENAQWSTPDKFLAEPETDNHVPLLGVNLTKPPRAQSKRIFGNTTWNGQYVNFQLSTRTPKKETW